MPRAAGWQNSTFQGMPVIPEKKAGILKIKKKNKKREKSKLSFNLGYPKIDNMDRTYNNITVNTAHGNQSYFLSIQFKIEMFSGCSLTPSSTPKDQT